MYVCIYVYIYINCIMMLVKKYNIYIKTQRYLKIYILVVYIKLIILYVYIYFVCIHFFIYIYFFCCYNIFLFVFILTALLLRLISCCAMINNKQINNNSVIFPL